MATADETILSLTECGICLSEMENPKALPCLHSFCLECLKKVQHPPDIFICPLCKEQMNLPPGGIKGFRDNFFINQLKDLKTIQEMREVTMPCVCCKSTDGDTKARCIDCNGFLCQQCVSSHKSLKPLAAHKIFSIDELRSGQIDMNEMIKKETCQAHKDQVLGWFCKPCNIPICSDCKLMNHIDHEYIAIEGQTNEIKVLISNCKGLSKLVTDNIEETEQVKSNVNKAVDNTKIELEQERKAYMEAIQRSYEENMEELAHIQKEQLDKIDSTRKDLEFMQSNMNNAIEIANGIIKTGSMQIMASNYSSLNRLLTKDSKPSGTSKSIEVVKFKPKQIGVKKVVDIGMVGVKKVVDIGTVFEVCRNEVRIFEKDIGTESKVCQKEPGWIFEKNIGKQGDTKNAYGIAVSPHKLFVVADSGRNRIVFFDQQGNLMQERKKNLTNPTGIAMTLYGIYIADMSPFIKSCGHDGNFVMQFPAISPDGKTSSSDGSHLYGVATDKYGTILVGNLAGKYISRHMSDGTHISSFAIGINPYFLKVTANGSIVVTSFRPNVPAHILDPDGNHLYTINKPKDAKKVWCPSGIACSVDGQIFITSYGDGIYSFTEQGKYLGCVIKDMDEANGLDVYENKLVITQLSGIPVKIYAYQ